MTEATLFDRPKYIEKLIESINDGAKSAQTGAIAFTVVGLYLLATALATSDEDLFLEHTTTISQIGVQVPVVVSFAIAPVLFVAIHIFILIRYDLLAANLNQLNVELQVSALSDPDRERCRQLLANVEFVQLAASQRSWSFLVFMLYLVIWAIIALMPLFVLCAVLLSTLRYQSYLITHVQKTCLAADLVLLVWYAHRQLLWSNPDRRTDMRSSIWLAARVLAAAVLLGVIIMYAKVPGPEVTTVEEGRDEGVKWDKVFDQPLDFVLCPEFHFGCRYLAADHRALIAKVWDTSAIRSLRSGIDDRKVPLASIEGVFLRGRSLRFANLAESQLYNANLSSAELQGAKLNNARLQGAILSFAYLSGADLEDAHLEGVDLQGAHLARAKLARANFQGASLFAADLNGAELGWADLRGANLRGAEVRGADLIGAQMQGANLFNATLTEAILGRSLEGGLEEADPPTRLNGANLFLAQLEKVQFSQTTDLTLVNVTSANFVPAIPPSFGAEKHSLFASDPKSPGLSKLDGQLLTSDEATYNVELSTYLTDELAVVNPVVAHGIAQRALAPPDWNGESYPIRKAIACRLLVNIASGKVSLAGYPDDIDQLHRYIWKC